MSLVAGNCNSQFWLPPCVKTAQCQECPWTIAVNRRKNRLCLYVIIEEETRCVSMQSFSSLLWAFSKMGICPPTSYLDRASEVMERREIEGLQVCSWLENLLCFSN